LKEYFMDARAKLTNTQGQFLKGFTWKKTPTVSTKPPSVQATLRRRREQASTNIFDPHYGGV